MTNLTTEELAQYKSHCEDAKSDGRPRSIMEAGVDDVLRMCEEIEAAREANRKLSESQTFMRRVLAAVAYNAGGEIIVSGMVLSETALNPTILTWTDEQLRLHVKVQKEPT